MFKICELWSCDMNSTLGSFVPLAMFLLSFDSQRRGTHVNLKLKDRFTQILRCWILIVYKVGTSRNDNFMIFLCLKVHKKPWGCLKCTWCFMKALKIFWGCLNCTWGCLKVLKKTLGLFELCQARCFGPLKKVILPRMVRSLLMIDMWHVYVYLGIGQITFWSHKFHLSGP